jgi:hypothetical protein
MWLSPPLRGGFNIVEEIIIDSSVGTVTVDMQLVISHHPDQNKLIQTMYGRNGFIIRQMK